MDRKPAIVGHSFGGLLTQILAGARPPEAKGRGHALTIDSGWREVADTALAFVKRFAAAAPAQIRSTGTGGSARVPP